MNIHNSIKIIPLILVSNILLLSDKAQADDWTCTDVASIKNENSVMACGVATADTEGEAREKALRRARTEFELICETSAECVGKQTIVEPLRNSCEILANGRYKCFRGLRYTILDSSKPAQRPIKTKRTEPKQEQKPAPAPVRSARIEQSAFENDESKKFAIGVASYALSIAYSDNTDNDTEDFSGGSFFLQFAPLKHIAAKLYAYSLTHDELDDATASGTDIQLLIGSNFTQPGGNFYFGIGMFDETWEIDNGLVNLSKDFSGSQFTIGMGYNWSYVLIDFHLSFREKKEYEDYYNSLSSNTLFGESEAEVAAVSGALSIGFRF